MFFAAIIFTFKSAAKIKFQAPNPKAKNALEFGTWNLDLNV